MTGDPLAGDDEASAGLGRGQVDKGQEPRGSVHHDREGGCDLADPEVHHLQSNIAAGGRGQCQCPGGKPGQEVNILSSRILPSLSLF